MNERSPSDKDKEKGISSFFFFFFRFGKGTGSESNYSRNEPDRLVSKIASLPLIRAFSRFDNVDARSKVDAIRSFRLKMEFQSGFALVEFVVDFKYFYEDNSLIILAFSKKILK